METILMTGNISVCNSTCPVFEYYLNYSCVSECPSPFFKYTDPINYNLRCVLCNNSDYYLPDRTCASECPNGTQNRTRDGINYCDGPCVLDQFSFFNNCVSTCNPPYHVRVDNITHIPKCEICEGSKAILPNLNCADSCPAPLNETVSNGTRYCKGPCPINTYQYKNGSCLPNCEPPYNITIYQTYIYRCEICPYPKAIMPNSSCVNRCPPLMNNATFDSETFCIPKCNSSQYLLNNGTCVDNCMPPYIAFFDSNINTNRCSVCNGTDLILPNYRCANTCPPGLQNMTLDSEPICKGRCFFKEYMFNQSCFTECPIGTVSYINITNYAKHCYLVVEILKFIQVSNTELQIIYNVSIDSDFIAGNIEFHIYAGNQTIPIKSLSLRSNDTIIIQLYENMTWLYDQNITFAGPSGIFQYDYVYSKLLNKTIAYINLEPEPVLSKAVTATIQATGQAVIATAAASVIAGGSSVGFKGQISMMQYLMTLLFLNVDYPQRVLDFLEIFKIARMGFVPNPFEWIFGDLSSYSRPSPFKFISNKFNAFFFYNVGNIVFILAVFSIFFITFSVLKSAFKEKKKIRQKILHLRDKVCVFGIFTTFSSFSVIITVSCSLQLFFPDFGEGVLIFSFCFSILVILFQILAIAFVFSTHIKMKKDLKKMPDLLEKYETIFGDSAKDHNGVPYPYIGILLSRDIFQFGFLVLLYYNPFFQVISQLVFTVFLLSGIIRKKPFRFRSLNLLELVREGAFTGLYIIISLIMRSETPRNEDVLGLIMISLCISVIAIHLLSTVVNLLISISEFLKERLKKKNLTIRKKNLIKGLQLKITKSPLNR